ncbi:tetratricopeptide repeat protein [Roseibacillus persicicus]|uniref:tetratricopeptide repeat protein n=1 Tax=Roseibacillus persicicus TaxID=454148 RepID=UPI00398A7569
MKDAHTFFRVLVLSLISTLSAWSQDNTDPSKLDPSDIYFQGWMALRDADEYQKEEDYPKAFEAATRCKRLIDTVSLYHPQWKPHLIERKQKEAVSVLEKIAPLLPEANRTGLQLYRGDKQKSATPTTTGLTPAEIVQATRIQRELKETKARLNQMDDVRNADVARLQRRISELTAERDRLAESTLNLEIKELKNRIDLVEDEKSILARQLADTRTELSEARKRMAELGDKEKESRKVANQLNALLEKERGVANEVINGLRAQQKKLSQELTETKQMLLAERKQSERLERLLTDARGEVETLTSERNHLLKERDHLAELLQLNQGDRIQRLIEQNMTLARNLREAEEAMKNLAENSDAKTEELLNAERDLAMAKSQIIEQRQESDSELQRRLGLERKLKEAYEELKARESLADMDSDLLEENRELRSVVEKLLVTQKRRREEAEMLMKIAKEKQDDPDFAQAVEQLVGEEMTLTADEQVLVEASRSDGQFTLPTGRNDPEQVQLSNAQLRRYISALGTAIEKAYARGKTEVALDLCEQLLDEHPGHVPTMLDQGVISLKMALPEQAIDSFNNAITMQIAPLPYAHFMKGVAYHSLGRFAEAQKEYEIAIQLNPSNAEAHNRLGGIHGQMGRLGEAREHFEMAHRLDKTKLEPLFNLSALHRNMGEEDAALNYYRQFRKFGGQPNPEFEKLLAKAQREAAPEEAEAEGAPVIALPEGEKAETSTTIVAEPN